MIEHSKGKESSETNEKVGQRQVKVDTEDKDMPKGRRKIEESNKS